MSVVDPGALLATIVSDELFGRLNNVVEFFTTSLQAVIAETCAPGKYASMLHVYALAFVGGVQVRSAYADRQLRSRPFFNTTIFPRSLESAAAGHDTMPTVSVMWTHTSTRREARSELWMANHFVPLLAKLPSLAGGDSAVTSLKVPSGAQTVGDKTAGRSRKQTQLILDFLQGGLKRKQAQSAERKKKQAVVEKSNAGNSSSGNRSAPPGERKLTTSSKLPFGSNSEDDSKLEEAGVTRTKQDPTSHGEGSSS